ncbi:MAG: aspartate-semialdehyde dehydrogenase [candidate division Zixibacteria bacterium]|nr:aspartate-semialdehyde dehydrogenase [Candidatus Tariuqbacter arcticus]
MRIAIVGATGIVGEMFLRLLEERDFPVTEIIPYASSRSAGETVSFRNEKYPVRDLSPENIEPCELALFSAGADTAMQWARRFVDMGALVVDNSSAFRAIDDVPLVVPEVNPEAIILHKGIIANPNCSTIGLVAVVYPLHHRFNLKSMVITSFQSVSGAGRTALAELQSQIENPSVPAKTFPRRIADNCIPQIGDFLLDGETEEERKFRDESRKIMNAPGIEVAAAAVRVPIKIGHSLSLHARFQKPVTPDEAKNTLANAPGVKLLPENNAYPTPLEAAGRDEIFVGRIRSAQGFANSLNLWIVLDNLRKGAAANAVKIAEFALLDRNWW